MNGATRTGFRGGWGLRCQYDTQSPKVIVIQPRSGALSPEQLDLMLLTVAKPRISRNARRRELKTQLTQRRSLAEELLPSDPLGRAQTPAGYPRATAIRLSATTALPRGP
jgi:hypothetical protein